jgi:hypothetical protein
LELVYQVVSSVFEFPEQLEQECLVEYPVFAFLVFEA